MMRVADRTTGGKTGRGGETSRAFQSRKKRKGRTPRVEVLTWDWGPVPPPGLRTGYVPTHDLTGLRSETVRVQPPRWSQDLRAMPGKVHNFRGVDPPRRPDPSRSIRADVPGTPGTT